MGPLATGRYLSRLDMYVVAGYITILLLGSSADWVCMSHDSSVHRRGPPRGYLSAHWVFYPPICNQVELLGVPFQNCAGGHRVPVLPCIGLLNYRTVVKFCDFVQNN